MECNRSEAVRAMEMAEQKFASQEYAAARKLALRAQQLFPSIENIAQMIAVIDVHVAAQTRIGINEKDWYGILQIEPTADDALVKKQYRKLALFLHPDKNKAIGAESAFKLIGEALQVLSDKVKRLVYDAKRGMHARANNPFSGNADGVNNGWQNHLFQQHNAYPDATANSNTFNKASQRHFPQPPQVAVPGQPEFHLFTFWTACTSCQMRYQYYRKYENQNLLCPQCRRPFIAKDLSSMQRGNVAQAWPPRTGESVLNGLQARQSNPHMSANYESNPHIFPNYSSSSFKYFNGFTSGSRSDTFQAFAGMAGHVNGTVAASVTKNETTFASCGTGVRGEPGEAEKELLRKIKELRRAAAREQAKQKNLLRRSLAHERAREALARSFSKEGSVQNASFFAKKMKLKKHNADSSSSDAEEDDEFWERVPGKEGRDDSKASAGQSSGFKRSSTHISNGSSADHVQEVLAGKKVRIETEIGTSKQDPEAVDMARRLADLAKNAIRLKLNLQKAKPVVAHCSSSQASVKRESVPMHKERRAYPDRKKESVVKEEEVVATCSVPDADFHNFDEGREEKDVEVGQIWALYDDKDGMPKYYMKVKEVHSRTPFKVSIGWFELRKPSDEICELLDLGFAFACGEFRISSSQVMDSVNSFSHLVNWEKSGKGLVKIYPKKGEVWCIYKDWEAGQQLFRVGDALVGYSMVEVLSDCSEASGAAVMPLYKVEGFKTIFHLTNEQVFQVPFLELRRFSHRVPAHKLKGNEAPGIPKDCWELDPAAIPSCLVHPDQNDKNVAATI